MVGQVKLGVIWPVIENATEEGGRRRTGGCTGLESNDYGYFL